MTRKSIHPMFVEGVEYLVVGVPLERTDALLELTPAEREVARMVARGLSTLAIARERGTSTATISNQLSAIYRKLGVSSRVALCARLAR